MTSPLEFWEKKHRNYKAEPWVQQGNYFAEEVADLITVGSTLLDLGCGQGQDSIYFARRGALVTSADFSPYALSQLEVAAAAEGIQTLVLNLEDLPYPFATATFDVVYAHLSLHYFSQAMTTAIFAEVARVLRPGGYFLATFNSVDDEEFETGERIESHYFELESGDRKRYFDEDQVRLFATDLFAIQDVSRAVGTRKKAEDRIVRLIAMREAGA